MENRPSPRSTQKRTIQQSSTPTLSTLRSRLKQPKQMIAISILLVAILGVVSFAAALTHTVEQGDTLYALARKYNTTVEEIAADNDIDNVNLILIGQQLTINEGTASSSSGDKVDAEYQIPSGSGAALKAAIDVQFNIPSTPKDSAVNPDVSPDKSCMRFNFHEGKDRLTGSRGGVFVLFEDTNGALTSWYAPAGATDSGWYNGFNITFEQVFVKVLFYPSDGSTPVVMEIVNPAPDMSYSWLARGMCHAVEIQYPS